MARKIRIQFRDKECFEVEEGTPLYEVANKVSKYYNFPIMVAKLNNEIVDLEHQVVRKSYVDFYDRSDPIGNDVYSSSVNFVMILATKRVYGKDTRVLIQNSIDNGVACQILDDIHLDKDGVLKIKKEMDNIVKQDLVYTSLNVRRIDAIKYFEKSGQLDKARSLKYITNSYITIDRIDDYYDYLYSKLAHSTKDVPDYKLTYVKDNAFVLSIPNIYNPETTLNYHHVPVVFDTFYNHNKWGRSIGINDAGDLNKFVSEGRAKDIIRMAELNFEGQLHDVADDIYEHKDSVKLVLLAGPSSSGKTTTSKKLSTYLEIKGFNVVTLSTDDYFLEKENTPKDINGDYDFECLNAIDLKLFNTHLNKLLKGEKILTPEYNFIEGKKEFKNRWIQMKPNDVLVIEGLHCLNEELTKVVPRKNKFKIFIGPFTQLSIDDHNRIHTSDTRRLRRIIRDNRTRGYGAARTLEMWSKIREGEIKYIYPFERDTDAIINSALIYELGVLKTYVEPLLFCVEEDDPMYPEALRLIRFLRNLLPIPSDDIPRESILREFIGGSGFYNE